jgi:site-specific DNA-methyltransferase (adenine-specific)
MRDMPDNSIDLVLTDPPYGKQWSRGKHGYGHSKDAMEAVESVSWDKKTPSKEYFTEVCRIGKNQIIFGGNYFVLNSTNCWLVWDKFGSMKNTTPFSDCELAWTSFNTVVKRYIFRQCGFIKDTKDERFHPTQKPSELFAAILTDYSNPNDLIFDPFCGSGTTCVAAKRLGRRYIGIDISPEYCEIARKRLEAEEKGITVKELEKGQGSLFNP